ncbi:hypothetical protein GETHLI_27760 [Geothrix limicola]|uniref:Uncharacterized protein n=1 Tax=Geothrix limicola TaxID=2927978 RepID=A0ABQ5QHD8_9BACT|nr:hypothetical protein [Geothrix limicola]GLH74274.1 hypothetical protein GETHLI_27760 [Geothrix limicola]
MRKKILLIGLNYHNYTQEVVRELERQGHEVRFYDIQPGKPALKVMRKFFPWKYQAALDLYHKGILEREKDRHTDMVLFIQVHQMSIENLEAMKRLYPSSEFVLYNWDAVSNHDYRPFMSYFDRIYTFDPADANALGVHYLPLFCLRDFQGVRRRDRSGKAVYTVGNIVNPIRYEAIKRFQRYCSQKAIPFHAFMVASTHGFTQLLKNGHLPYDVSLFSISMPKFVELIEGASAAFDFANHRQSGYTMRTIENLCAGRKIITNNSGIRDEPFFSEDRIHVFKDLDFTGVDEFLKVPLKNPDEVFESFHIDQFTRRLMGA